MGDGTAHGGSITGGAPTVLIGTGSGGSPTRVTRIPKKAFPKITPILRTMASLSGRRKQLNEAIANQEALRRENDSTEGEPRVYNLKWIKEDKIIRDRKVLKVVTLSADVLNVNDGESATIKVFRKSDNEEAQEVIELSGTVIDKKVTVEWEVEDATLEVQNSDS